MSCQPTEAPPGSTRKVRVLMERAARRESLFHPGDNAQRLLPVPAVAETEEEEDWLEFDLAG
ncbi:MAG: hypothetical protein K2W96_02670 [Gemmataceae bacterium]|nr:hypothetical protein [Gemmataceae bacterium]